jgi:uncharacterized protein HemY
MEASAFRSLMKSKKTTFLDAVSIVALTVLTAIFYVYSAILLELWLLKRKIRMGRTTTLWRRGAKAAQAMKSWTK